MGKKIRIAVAGVGNCASALIQGAHYYSKNPQDTIGLTAYDIAGYEPGDIEVVAAFDVADTKVGKDVSEAIYARPNNTITVADVPRMGIPVQKGPTMDGIRRHLSQIVTVSKEPDVDVKKVLRDTGAEMLVNYLPVGSTQAVRYYATQALEPILAPPYEATLLHVAPGSPLLLMHRVTYDQNGRAFEHVKSLYRGDRYKFVTELHRKADR